MRRHLAAIGRWFVQRYRHLRILWLVHRGRAQRLDDGLYLTLENATARYPTLALFWRSGRCVGGFGYSLAQCDCCGGYQLHITGCDADREIAGLLGGIIDTAVQTAVETGCTPYFHFAEGAEAHQDLVRERGFRAVAALPDGARRVLVFAREESVTRQT